jgi:hypothetical protein
VVFGIRGGKILRFDQESLLATHIGGRRVYLHRKSILRIDLKQTSRCNMRKNNNRLHRTPTFQSNIRPTSPTRLLRPPRRLKRSSVPHSNTSDVRKYPQHDIQITVDHRTRILPLFLQLTYPRASQLKASHLNHICAQ